MNVVPHRNEWPLLQTFFNILPTIKPQYLAAN